MGDSQVTGHDTSADGLRFNGQGQQTCRRCGEQYLRWGQTPWGAWRLHQCLTVHVCNVKPKAQP
jgi:hypothetical protein